MPRKPIKGGIEERFRGKDFVRVKGNKKEGVISTKQKLVVPGSKKEGTIRDKVTRIPGDKNLNTINNKEPQRIIKSKERLEKVDAFRKLREKEKMLQKLKADGQFSKAQELAKDVLKSKEAKTVSKSIGRSLKKKALKAIPLVGTAASAFAALKSGDVAAAVPGLESEATGPKKGSLEAKLEDPRISEQERSRIANILKKRFNQ